MTWDWDKLQEKRDRRNNPWPFGNGRGNNGDDRNQNDRDQSDRDRNVQPGGQSNGGQQGREAGPGNLGQPREGQPRGRTIDFGGGRGGNRGNGGQGGKGGGGVFGGGGGIAGLPSGKAVGIGLMVLLLGWLATGIYIVNPDEQGVVLRFGKYDRIEGPGPHYALPEPFETVYKPQVTRVLRSEVGFRSVGQQARTFQQGQVRTVPEEASMLTGDENIVNVQFSVQYKISDAVHYLFNVSEPTALVRNAAEAAMREVIGNSQIDSAITDGKLKIQSDATQLLQQVLNRYGAGIQVIAVQLQDVHPPQEVIDAFKDVASAREDKSRIINEAEAYRNELLPKARGQAAAIHNEASAYSATRIHNAEGEAARFDALRVEYEKSPKVTKQRLYYEAVEEILGNAGEKLLMDGNASSRALPYLPLPSLTGKPAMPGAEAKAAEKK